MKILLIQPKSTGYMGQVSRSGKAGFARLSLTTIAALTPPGHDVQIHDARLCEPDYDTNCDVVGLTAMTTEVPHAYRMADEFRKRGKKVVIGGYHATSLPEEAAEHADVVIAGEAERLWPQVVQQLANGGMTHKIHRETCPVEMEDMVIPRRDLIDREMYSTSATIQTTRGCPYDCDFCSVTSFFGKRFRHRPVEEVIREFESDGARNWMFLDDNLVGNTAYAKKLLKAMVPLRLQWGAQVSTGIMRDEELMDLFVEAGGRFAFMGFESLSPEVLQGVQKGWNHPELYKEGIRKMHRRGVTIMGSFIFGLDGDDLGVFRRTLDFVNDAKIDAPLYNILTPFPGTRLYDRMEAEGRIRDPNWANYDACHCVIEPKGMTSEELYEGWNWANLETYKWSNVLKRILRPDPGFKNRVASSYAYARKARKYCAMPPDPDKYANALKEDAKRRSGTDTFF